MVAGDVPRQLVLSLDLDFFVSPIAYHGDDVERLSPDEYSVDAPGAVRAFLETQCLLKKSSPVPGAVVTHNHEAFFVLRGEIAEGRLSPPFDLVHVDAHSDLGMGGAGYVFILTKLLKRPVNQRADGLLPDGSGMEGLTFGNWIAFVIANRWIRSLTFVTHPEYSNDLPWMYFKGIDVNSGVIQMRPRSREEIENNTLDGRKIFASGRTQEPRVTFRSVPRGSFRLKHPPDLIVVSHSPGYTPATADPLLGLIQGYVNPDATRAPEI